MSASIRIWAEGSKPVFPVDGKQPPARFDAFLTYHLDFYLDTAEPLLFMHIPTYRSTRVYHFFYQYRPEQPARLDDEFANLVEAIDTNQTGDSRERSRELPAGIDDSVLQLSSEKDWDLRSPNREIPEQFAHAEPGLPGLDSVQQTVFEDLVEEGAKLRFGMQDTNAALQVATYLLENNLDARVAVSLEQHERSFSAVDIHLIPGADENFNPLNESTGAVLKNRIKERIKRQQETIKHDAYKYAEELTALEDSYTVYHDLVNLAEQFNGKTDVKLRTDAATRIRSQYEKVQRSKYLSDSEREDVREYITSQVYSRRENVAERVRDEVETSVIGDIRAIQQEYEKQEADHQLKIALNIIGTDHSSDSGGLQNKYTVSIQSEWSEFVEASAIGDEMKMNVARTLRERIKSERKNIQDEIYKEIHENTDEKIDQRLKSHTNSDEKITALKELRRQLDSHNGFQRTNDPFRRVHAISYDDQFQERLLRMIREDLSDGLANAYREKIEKSIQRAERDHDSGSEEVISVLKNIQYVLRKNSNPVMKHGGEEAVEDIRRLYKDKYVYADDRSTQISNIELTVSEKIESHQQRRQELQSTQRGTARQQARTEQKSNKQKSDIEPYKTQIEDLFTSINRSQEHKPEIRADRYKTIQDIVKHARREKEYNPDSAKVRKFYKTWRDVIDKLDIEEREELREWIKGRINQELRDADKKTKKDIDIDIDRDGNNQVSSFIPTTNLFPFSPRVILAAAVIALVVVLFVGISSTDFDLFTESDDVSLNELQVNEENTVLVNGTATSDRVVLTFTPLNSERAPINKTVNVSDNRFRTEFGDLPPGVYRLRASDSGSNAEDTAVLPNRIDDTRQVSINSTGYDNSSETITVSGTVPTSAENLTVTLYGSTGERLDRVVAQPDGEANDSLRPRTSSEHSELNAELSGDGSGLYVVELTLGPSYQRENTDRRIVTVDDRRTNQSTT